MPKVLIRASRGTELRAVARQTGRYLMSYEVGADDRVSALLADAGFPAARDKPLEVAAARALPHGQHYMLPNLGFAVIDPHSEQEDALFGLAERESNVQSVTPEGIVRLADATPSTDYLRGWRDATQALTCKFLEPGKTAEIAEIAADVTWGLTTTGVPLSRYSGKGITVGILDTGLDVLHPDFVKRNIVTENLVGDGQSFHDGHGHGTHCTGTAAGPRRPQQGQRYGIAYQSNIYSARVLNDAGRGVDATIIQGIEHAVRQGCAVVSISIGTAWSDGDLAFDYHYEQAIARALELGTLCVIAAGNESSAVGTPGNSPSALTVAALDQSLATAWFSNRVVAGAPGVKGPDCAAPGVGVYSSWLTTGGSYKTEDGTSMATPHVAGIAALLAQSDASLRGAKLKAEVIRTCQTLADAGKRLGEIGAGLAKAP